MTEKRYYCDDNSEYRDYGIFDLKKADKTKDDFQDEDSILNYRFDNYLIDETDAMLTGEEVMDKLNEYELLLGKIKKLCNQNRIPNLLTTYIPVNCEKKKDCLDNHMINASNMGKSNLAKEILKLIGRE